MEAILSIFLDQCKKGIGIHEEIKGIFKPVLYWNKFRYSFKNNLLYLFNLDNEEEYIINFDNCKFIDEEFYVEIQKDNIVVWLEEL